MIHQPYETPQSPVLRTGRYKERRCLGEFVKNVFLTTSNHFELTQTRCLFKFHHTSTHLHSTHRIFWWIFAKPVIPIISIHPGWFNPSLFELGVLPVGRGDALIMLLKWDPWMPGGSVPGQVAMPWRGRIPKGGIHHLPCLQRWWMKCCCHGRLSVNPKHVEPPFHTGCKSYEWRTCTAHQMTATPSRWQAVKDSIWTHCWWKRSGDHQLRLVVEIYHYLQGLMTIPGGWGPLGFLVANNRTTPIRIPKNPYGNSMGSLWATKSHGDSVWKGTKEEDRFHTSKEALWAGSSWWFFLGGA